MPVFSGSDIAKSVKLLTTAAIVVADPTGLSAVGVGLDVLLQYHDKTSAKHPELKKLEKELVKDLKARLAKPSFHRPQGAELHLPQMIEAALLAPGDFTNCNLDPTKIIDVMITRLSEAEHNAPEMISAFRNLYLPVLTKLMSDPRLTAVINPAIQRKLLEQNTALAEKIDHLAINSAAPAERLGVTQGLVISLARRVAADVEDFDAAYKELERAIDTAAELKKSANLPTNRDGAVKAVLKRMTELNEADELDAAAAEVDRALEAAEAEGEALVARKVALLGAGVEQDILRRNPTSAAARLVARLGLEVAQRSARFAALRALWLDWYERGRDKGLNFDAEVAVALAQASVDIASGADQTGTALNYLGMALETLGEREAETGRLDEAATAYRNALKEWTRERVPLQWAMNQMNLGNALRTIGARETGSGRLEEAVAAYRNALKERTRERVPLQWAMTQMNLGTALRTLGERVAGTEQLDEAVTAYRNALKEWTRKRVPLDWAVTQMNLGNALQTLGARETGTGRLEEAVTAYRDALKERTRERVPLKWAATQTNLGEALRKLGQREAGTKQLEDAVTAFRDALKELTRERVPLQWAMTQMNLGSALTILGGREAGTGRLDEAVTAYQSALKEYTRERVPLDWAKVQGNLANVELAFFEKERDVARLDAAEAYARAALEVFEGAGASQYVQMAEQQLAETAELRG